jgi:hypothetical protein
MLYGVGITHILYFCNASCRSAKNVVMVMMMVMVVVVMMMMMMTMMSKRRMRRYLRTVTFESVYKTPLLLLHSSISVHGQTVNSLFSLPHSMLKVLYRNLPACHFIGEEER